VGKELGRAERQDEANGQPRAQPRRARARGSVPSRAWPWTAAWLGGVVHPPRHGQTDRTAMDSIGRGASQARHFTSTGPVSSGMQATGFCSSFISLPHAGELDKRTG